MAASLRRKIRTELSQLLADTKYWIENKTCAPAKIAIKFKHRIVSIHCFPNGNGRHSRLMADIIIDKVFKRPVFTWGAAGLVRAGDQRMQYLKALKEADKGDIKPLIIFARS